MRIAFDGTTLRPGPHGRRLLLRAPAASPGRGSRRTTRSSSCRTGPSIRRRRCRANVGPRIEGWRTPRLVWMQLQAPRLLRGLGADVAHFTNGMMPIASSVPTVVTIHDMSLTLYPRFHPTAARAAEQAARGSGGPPRRRHHHGVRERPARHHRAVPAVAGPRARRPRGGGAVVPPVVDRGARSPACGEVRARRARHPVRGHDRAEEEPAEADRRVRGALARRRSAGPPARLRRTVRMALARRRAADRRARRSATPSASPDTCRSRELPVLYSLAEVFVFPVDVRRLRPAGHRGDGVRHAGHHRAELVARRGRRRRHPARRPPRRRRARRGDRRARPRSGRRAELSAQGLRRARMFSWQRAARETLAIYEGVAGRRSAVAHS